MRAEIDARSDFLRNRADAIPAIEPFIADACRSAASFDVFPDDGRPEVMALCVQVPPELFDAAGVRVVKLACGSFTAGNLAAGNLPALTCPMIRSVSGMFRAGWRPDADNRLLVIPTTCDWVVKWRELSGIDKARVHYLDLPHLREDENASNKWLEEIYGLKKWLEALIGRSVTATDLARSVERYRTAYKVFSELIDARRKRRVPSVHFMLVANALPYGDIGRWTENARAYLDCLPPENKEAVPVFFAGSPVVFPNVKLPVLIEDAGMRVVADDVCTMERALTGPVLAKDRSGHALLRAMAERAHKACICPTFADNDRRLNAMVNVLKTHGIQGVVFHVLKGCHPYDIEAAILEEKLKARGIRFLKIETDYVREDEQNIVTRLEAFGRTLEK